MRLKKLTLRKNNLLFIVIISIVLIYCLIVVGSTYAYLSSGDTSENVNGDIATTSFNLVVKKIAPEGDDADKGMVPLEDDAIGNAISSTTSCIDSIGNVSCQVYEITLTNNSETNYYLGGTIELVASGDSSSYTNLKWEELESSTTRKSNYTINGMSKSTLVDSVYMEPNDNYTYYIVVWISEIDEDQKDIDKGNFKGIVNFTDTNGSGVTATFDGYESVL